MRRRILTWLVAVGALALVAVSPAAGTQGAGFQAQAQTLAADPNFKVIGDDVADSPAEIHAMYGMQHGGPGDHLPGSSENVTLLGQVDIEGAAPDRVADVAAWGNYAYLAVRDPEGCTDAGFAVIDISDPTAPVQVGFIDWTDGSFPGEGAQVIELRTEFFTGPVLLGNNEVCDPETGNGGLTLWDVTDPLNPQQLVDHAGDPDFGDAGGPYQFNDIHSVFGWQQQRRAYAVMTDNFEFEDIDIMDITDPRNPTLVAEIDANDFGVAREGVVSHGNFQGSFLHDMVVKRIGRTWTLLVSYWDGGWVQFNVNDPANPEYMIDSDYPLPDTLFPNFQFPEGNAHQAEFTRNNRWLIGTDEDFSPFRLLNDEFAVTSGPNAGNYPGGEFGWTVPIASYPDGQVNGPTIYGGYGCPDISVDGTDNPPPFDLPVPPASSLPADPGEEKVLILQRGQCFFSEKVETAQNAGYDAVIIGNHHAGSGNGADPDASLCGSQGHVFTPTIAAACTGHRAFHLILGTTPNYDPPGPPHADDPAIGTLGADVLLASEFDGWGYVRLLDRETMEQVDAYAIDEALDPAFATGFGALSVHEVAVDPFKRNIAYLSYYSGGMRVIQYGPEGLEELGHYVDEDGNDFWGVQVHKLRQLKKPTVILESDRDSGLWIFQYQRP
ncbi:MAG TPA: PA domain-containing protein [Gaiellaceae bacterium]|nr:PA domain-containing protein [Gaiellaceae bacterium]